MAKQLKPGQGPLDYSSRWWMKATFILVSAFLYIPIATLIAFSFNSSKYSVWKSFTLENYVNAWHNDVIFFALSNSLAIAFISTLFSTIFGVTTAIALWRFRFPARVGFEIFLGMPIVVPEICMGVAMALFFSQTGLMLAVRDLVWPLNLSNIIIAHIAFSFPFVAVVVRARLVGFNRQLEEASKDLGATEWQTFWNVIIPFLMPSIVAGGLLAFTLSLDDFVITFFSSGPGSTTFPVKIYSMVKNPDPRQINAASTVLIIITVLATVLATKFQSPGKSGTGH
ncbi:ABC transporter permease [Aestuariivirga litoralis]|uniref:ABC transporter permease n=1 Tax=Aestuariivirga litoralis TaxID=2650924 RepID=UPI0018C75507|nr:ABC transporter permease [Aestuariivirga litoralis]MBG1232069.1 ABC transporter permease [Aestuariivirga litoralis]